MVLKVYLLTFDISLAKAYAYLCINMNVSLFSFLLALIAHWLIINAIHRITDCEM